MSVDALTAQEVRVVRKVGEGVDKPTGDQELPIDINYQKLSEWLVTRKKLPSDWHKRVQAIQAKAHETVKQLDTAILQQLPGGVDAPLDYFRAVLIRDKLASTSDRGLFGGLTGTAAVWDNIVKAYEKNLLFVGEAAQNMVQNVDYEIPFLRKQAAKHNQQILDFQRKHAEYLQSAATCAANFKEECKKLGIEGHEVRTELSQLTKGITPIFQELIEFLQNGNVAEAMQYYSAFSDFAHRPGSNTMPVCLEGSLTTLAEVRQGTTAPPILATDKHPAAAVPMAELTVDWDITANSTAVAPDIDWDLSGAGSRTATAPAGIDWDLGGADGAAETAPAAINWDLGSAEAMAAPVEISWDVEADATNIAPPDAATPAIDINWDLDLSAISLDAAGSAAADAAPVPHIDWDITAEDVAAATSQGTEQEQVARAGVRPGAAPEAVAGTSSGDDDVVVARLSRDPEYRNCLLDDLQELAQFLQLRREQLSSSSTAFFMTVFPEQLQAVDVSAISAMQAILNSALRVLRSDRLRQLLLIEGSPSYVDRLVRGLERRAGQEGKLVAASREMEAKRIAAQRELVALQPRINQLLERTRTAKTRVEAALSKHLAGRSVNILGEINNVLAQGAAVVHA